MSCLIGIDLGTSGVKALLLSEDGRILGVQSAAYAPDFGKSGFVEQDPAVWWEKTAVCVKALTDANPDYKNAVRAVAVSGQMHSSVFLDKNGAVIRKAILWNDTRTTKQTGDIYENAGGRQAVLDAAFNLALEGFTLPKILWLKDNEPGNFAKVDKVIMPKDYINYRLTGVIKTDFSDAAGTLAFDVNKRVFNEAFISKNGLNPAIFPEAIESTGVVGEISIEAAAALGLPENTAIIAGGADNSCAAVGNGVTKDGDAVISVGTSGTVVAFLSGIKTAVTGSVHLFNYSYPGAIYAMGCMLCAGESLNWLNKSLFSDTAIDDLIKAAEKASAGAGGVIFLPYLYGERSPHNDPAARGVFFGLTPQTGRAEMTRAVLEGVAFGIGDMFEAVSQYADIKEISITGGGAKSPLWAKIIASVINRPLNLLNIEQGPAFGAALIAGVGAGVFADFNAAKNACVKTAGRAEPDAALVPEYKKYHALYKALYRANAENFKKLAEIAT